MQNCNSCQSSATKLLKCSKCLSDQYCSKACQKQDWKAGHKSICGKSLEDVHHESEAKSSATTTQVEFMNNFMKMALTGNKGPLNPEVAEVKKAHQFYEKVPDLKAEAMKMQAKHFGDVPDSAFKLLENVVILNRSIWMHEMAVSREKTEENQFDDPKNLIKMLGTNDPHKFEWFFTSNRGDVYGKEILILERQKATPYNENGLFHSFSNARVRTDLFVTGKDHVAVGFVDLSLLL